MCHGRICYTDRKDALFGFIKNEKKGAGFESPLKGKASNRPSILGERERETIRFDNQLKRYEK